MVRPSLQVDPKKLAKVKKAFQHTRLTQQQLAELVDLGHRQQIGKFLKGETVGLVTFQEICRKLDLDWEEIASPPKDSESELEEKEKNNASPPQNVEFKLVETALDNSCDIDALVQKAGILQVSADKLEPVKQALESFSLVIQAQQYFEHEKVMLQEKKHRQGYLNKQNEMRLNQKNLSLAEKFEALAKNIKSAIQPIEHFFAGEPIERAIFINICSGLKLEWRSVLDINFLRVIALVVPQVRSQCYNKIQNQCGTLQILDVARPIKLDDLYVHVNILDEPMSYERLERSDFPQVYNPRTNEFNRWGLGKIRKPRVPGLEVIESKSKLMVLGRPGAGKSTFLQHIAIQCNEGQLQVNRVPIFIRLKTFAEDASNREDFNLLHYINELFDSCGVVNLSVTEKLLNHGGGLILLDGLDEVAEENSDEVVKQIRWFSEKYYKNYFIITCRIAAQKARFPNFTDIEVADFNDEQIKDFANKWFIAVDRNSEEEGKEKAIQFIEKLNLPLNRPIREIAVTPILLILTCLVFQSKTEFPSNRARLYEEGLEILLTKWDESRDIERDNAYQNLSFLHKKQLLSQVAAITFERGDYFLEQDKLQQLIANYLCTLPDANSDPIQLQLDSQAVLKSIEVQHGLLVERSRRIYSFSHLTFQEYFTARAFIDSPEPQALNRFVNHITERGWQEVFLLAVGMSPSAARLLLLMKKQVDSLVEDDEQLQEFLRWVKKKSDSVEVPYKSAAVRAFYFSLAFPGPTITQNCASSIINDLMNNLDGTLAHSLGANPDQTLILVHALALAPDLVSSLGQALFLGLHSTLKRDLGLELKEALQDLKQQLPILAIHSGKEKIFEQWWKNNGLAWTEQLRSVMIEYRNIGHDWQFNLQQHKLLTQYYDANLLLVNCLNSDCSVSPEMRQGIEDTLLLPMCEIKE